MTKVPKYWNKAKKYLSKKDKIMLKLISNYQSPAEIILRGVPVAAFEFDNGQFSFKFQISTSLISATFLMDEFLFWSVISKFNQAPSSIALSDKMLVKSNLLDHHLGVSLLKVSVQIQRSSFS